MGDLGSNIRKYRNLKGYTQEQLSKMLGKSKNVVSNWENGVCKPDADTLENILWALEVDANTLFDWDSPEQIKEDTEKLAREIRHNPKAKNLINLIINLSESDIDFVTRVAENLINKGDESGN